MPHEEGRTTQINRDGQHIHEQFQEFRLHVTGHAELSRYSSWMRMVTLTRVQTWPTTGAHLRTGHCVKSAGDHFSGRTSCPEDR